MKRQQVSSKNLGRAIAKGAAWNMAIKLVRRSFGIVSALILARMLTPSDFGVYALAMSVYAFVELMGAFGFGAALIQNQDATDGHYDTAWTLNLLFSLLCAVVLFAVAPFAADILGEPKLTAVLWFTCLLFLMDAVRNIGVVNFQKYMTFDKDFRMQVAAKVAAFSVTVPMAFILKSYWAMLYGLFAAAMVRLVLSYTMTSYRPSFGLPYWREMLGFSFWLQLNNIINYFNRNIENFLISHQLGTAAVGALSMAKEFGRTLMEVSLPINRAAYPAYARVNKDLPRLREIYYGVVGNLAVMALAVGVGTTSIAHLFVPTLLGDQWLHIIPLIQWLSISSILSLFVLTANQVLIALGKVRWGTMILAIRLALFVIFILALLPLAGLVGVAYAVMATFALVLCISMGTLKRAIQFEFKPFFYLFFKPIVAALVMGAAIRLTFPEHWSDEGIPMQLLQLLSAVVLGGSCYILVLLGLWFLESRPEGPESHFLKLAWEKTGLFGFLLPEAMRQK